MLIIVINAEQKQFIALDVKKLYALKDVIKLKKQKFVWNNTEFWFESYNDNELDIYMKTKDGSAQIVFSLTSPSGTESKTKSWKMKKNRNEYDGSLDKKERD